MSVVVTHCYFKEWSGGKSATWNVDGKRENEWLMYDKLNGSGTGTFGFFEPKPQKKTENTTKS